MLSWFGETSLAESPESGRLNEITPTMRVEGYGETGGAAVFMYSATSVEGGVTLQLRDSDEMDEKSGLASVLARIHHDDTLSITYPADIIADGNIDVLLGTSSLNSNGNAGSSGFDLFDSDNGQDLTLSPQTFTSSTEAFINENSNSLGVNCADNDTVGSTEDVKGAADSSKLLIKKPRPKATSPNRQGPQQCQVLPNEPKTTANKPKLNYACLRNATYGINDQICGKVFGNASALAKHKLTHSDERKYVCSMCGKAFKRQDHLNGHMLTHRNKKPYECKAEGCGKSYCDARSLRRHTENHHAGSGGVGSSTCSPGSAEDGSPHSSSSSCIQYAPPPPPPTSQLHQLLASEPASSSTPSTSKSNGSNDRLTKQQLDLIQQIMEQTQKQAAAATPHQEKTTKAVPSSTTQSTSTTKPKTWTVQTTPCLTKALATITKPVECNLCHRKFKNIPALNGHMRLHGGYFKKDSEAKKCDKKEVNGPPLQTASMSVRALIEEKIIQKRTINPNLSTQTHANASVNTTTEKTFTVIKSAAESEEFLSPRTPPSGENAASGTNSQSAREATAKRIATKSGVKRASSDPGLLQPSASDSSQLQLNIQNESNYSLGVYGEDGDYFPPSLHDDMFQHSVQDSMLLQGVDPTQLAESIQAATLQDIASLDDYQSSTANLPSPQSFQHHQDIQNVLDSPLPVSLADFAYSHSQPTTRDSSLVSNTYTNSPLPSPSYTYPTPPASQEGQSPSFPPLQSATSHGSVSSPLSAAFYTSAMSSSAAVEAALSEVLPQQAYPSPPPQSPLSGTPVPSPLSLPPSSSPLPHHALQSQMMPNSNDPLLSSSPKDFGSRKKFDFQTFKIVNNGTIDLGAAGAQGVTGIVLERNGELKLIQTSCFQPVKASLMAGTTVYVNAKQKIEPVAITESGVKAAKTIGTSTKTVNGKAGFKNDLRTLEVEENSEEDVFLSPSVPSSPVRALRKKPRLDGSCMSQPSFHSRLRTAKSNTSNGKQILYTPPPILPPSRLGQGLYWQSITTWPSSTTLKGSGNDELLQESEEAALQSDVNPHINIGPQFQCEVPDLVPNQPDRDPAYEHLLWDPGISKDLTENEIDMFLEFACCAAVPGGGRNKEYALHLLHLCHGKVHDAMIKIMQPTPSLPVGHPLLTFEYLDCERWNMNEMEVFHQALLRHDKDFPSISQEVGTKTVKQCIQFYYLWKKVCPEDYKRLRFVRRRNREAESESDSSKNDIPANDVELVSTSSESRLFVCEYQDCSASFNSRAALNGHIRIHVGGTTGRCPTPDKKSSSSPAQLSIPEPVEEFPCKICGKIFNKVKSRSAHMKSHRPPDAEPRKPKLDPHKLEIAEQFVGRAMGVSSSSASD